MFLNSKSLVQNDECSLVFTYGFNLGEDEECISNRLERTTFRRGVLLI